PVHHVGGPYDLHRTGEPLDDETLARLVDEVRASATRMTAAALDEIAAAADAPIRSVSLRSWSADFPRDIAVQRRVPYESRADSVMYREVLAALARERGWAVHLYEAGEVEVRATRVLGERARAVLYGPRTTLGPPWTKDHRTALAATVLAG
ncbi:MAG: hypothetical protein J0H43_05555, partial [Actinobacteria bacterium]|nr:hypothetical protein [Actinomycetota bacterium]